MTSNEQAPGKELLAALAARLPALELSTEDLEFFRTDIYFESSYLPLAVAVPRNAAEIQDLVRVAGELGISLCSRGGGLSYSAGYIPADDRTVIVDTRHLNRIVELNERDRYVTVETGVTWAQLRDALSGTGLTPPFWGTFSGMYATIGGSASQHAKFFGSGIHGTSADAVIGLKVVTGRGDLVVTGSAASIHKTAPFWRNYGPDLTGMFLGDCGAFGIKVELTLQLIPVANEMEVASFSFEESDALMNSMAMISGEMLATEVFAMDPASVRARMKSEGISEDLKAVKAVATSGGLRGLKDAAAVVLGGRRFADKIGYLMNCITEGRDAHEAKARMARVREIVAQHGGEETVSSVPRVMRANPFPEPNGIYSPGGKRLNWIHTVVPNSRAAECFRRTAEVYARNAELCEKHEIRHGYLLSVTGPTSVGVETFVIWRDHPLPIHRHFAAAAVEKAGPRPHQAETRAAVTRISHDIIDAWAEMGGVHMQIGRKYPYYETRLPETAALLSGFKAMVDPHGILNPGNLFTRHKDIGE